MTEARFFRVWILAGIVGKGTVRIARAEFDLQIIMPRGATHLHDNTMARYTFN
jgi:hypothetical protein